MKKTLISVTASITVLVVTTLVIGFDEMMNEASQELLSYSVGVFTVAVIFYHNVLMYIERASVNKQKEGFIPSTPTERTSFLWIYSLALMAVVATPNVKYMLLNMCQLLVPALFLYSFLLFKSKKWYIGLFYPVRWDE